MAIGLELPPHLQPRIDGLCTKLFLSYRNDPFAVTKLKIIGLIHPPAKKMLAIMADIDEPPSQVDLHTDPNLR